MRYPLFIRTSESLFIVSAPDFPDFSFSAETLECAIDGATDALELYVGKSIGLGSPVIQPKSIAEHRLDFEDPDGVWAIADVSLLGFLGKSEKINITLPANLLKCVDDFVRAEEKLTRSGFLAEAALERLSSLSH